jgi:quinol monooxygenase YgiN
MTTIREDDFSVALINTFYVKPEKAEELVQLLTKATDDVMRHQPGFISANLHISFDKTRVVNYAQWRSKEDFERMQANPDAKPHMKQAAERADRFDPVLYTVAHVDNRSDKVE